MSGSLTKNNLEDLGADENGTPIPEFTGGFDATQIFRTGLPLGAYWANSVSYTDANSDGMIGCPYGPGEADCEFSVIRRSGIPRHSVPEGRDQHRAVAVRSGGRGSPRRSTAARGSKLYNLTGVYRNSIFANGVAVQLPDASNLKQQAAAQAAAVGFLGGYIEDASFTKLREVALSLTLPTRFAARAGAGSAVLTFAGRNLHTWTKYSGLDPEVNAGAQANFSTADFLTAPNVRYFTARLALSF